MIDDTCGGGAEDSTKADPRMDLARWANEQDEWIRFLVRRVLETGTDLAAVDLTYAYELFRQEKGLDPRTLDGEDRISIAQDSGSEVGDLRLDRVSAVRGVNALKSGEVIEPHEGLTILFGENGAGKTGYARILKALANSRTSDEVLGDIESDAPEAQSARLNYRIGTTKHEIEWSGEFGVPPFGRMSIFDNPAVNFHVDTDLEYVYVPASLSLFTCVAKAIKGVGDLVENRRIELNSSARARSLLQRFPRESALYAMIESLGAATDLKELSTHADRKPDAEDRLQTMTQSVAALKSGGIANAIKVKEQEIRSYRQAALIASTLTKFDHAAYRQATDELRQLRDSRDAFRRDFFSSAGLAAEPDQEWESFISHGSDYQAHLHEADTADDGLCIYCRQKLSPSALELIEKYRTYLDDQAQADIRKLETTLATARQPITELASTDARALISEGDEQSQQRHVLAVKTCLGSLESILQKFATGEAPDDTHFTELESATSEIATWLEAAVTILEELQTQISDREGALQKKEQELTATKAGVELARCWTDVTAVVSAAKEEDRLRRLVAPVPSLGRTVTELAKQASEQLLNRQFEDLFHEECEALRARQLDIAFVGRQGRPRRRKTLRGDHKPSKVLSEGEQKVLALADFLAEARQAGINAPVVFDDPVSSLDHRRVYEVAQRIANLAEDTQVIVFTHDILFATTLLSLMETSKRCTYYQVTDGDDGKGRVSKASGPSWDSLAKIKVDINTKIEAARNSEGVARDALVSEAYSRIRSWCEVFVESELLKGVSKRYQPNIRMTTLNKINVKGLEDAIAVVTRVFNEACRAIPGHSHPIETRSVRPTLANLESHWGELQDCRSVYLNG